MKNEDPQHDPDLPVLFCKMIMVALGWSKLPKIHCYMNVNLLGYVTLVLLVLKLQEQITSVCLRARLVDYLFPMSKVLKIRVGRSGKKKGRSTYNRVSNFFIFDRNAANAMARSTNMCT